MWNICKRVVIAGNYELITVSDACPYCTEKLSCLILYTKQTPERVDCDLSAASKHVKTFLSSAINARKCCYCCCFYFSQGSAFCQYFGT